jgi:hypothetical protein
MGDIRMKSAVLHGLSRWLIASIAIGLPLWAGAAERELILAGGSLRLCSSLSLRDCDKGATVAGTQQRAAPRYALDATSIDAALDPALWPQREPARARMRAVLKGIASTSGASAMDEDTLRARLDARCVNARDVVDTCAGDAPSPWRQLDDDQQASLLAAFETPQFDGAVRRRERASLAHSRSPHGADILRAFVAAAAQRSERAVPKIAVVTASAFDPFDPVDFYLDALREAGAEVEWWPLDAALAAAVFERRDCASLPALRLEILKLPARDRIYPDLVAQQQRACEDPDALAGLPQRVQGVFFAGGDQWKLRRAFFDHEDRPNAWLQGLREAVATGEVVIGGTSAGSAVQSGAAMLSNGTVEQALKHGAIASPPPVPGCARSGDCIGGLDEDAFTYWPEGGLGLAPGMIVDTHFSERARELRLLRLLADTGTRVGIGIDETSALHLRWRDDGSGDGFIEISALGASGGWVFDASGCEREVLHAKGFYLAPGAVLRSDASGLHWAEGANPQQAKKTNAAAPTPRDALDRGALRAGAQALDPRSSVARIRASAIDGHVLLTQDEAMRRRHDTNAAYASVGPLRIEVAPIPGCSVPQ